MDVDGETSRLANDAASAAAPMHLRMPAESSLRAYDERKYAIDQPFESIGTRDFSTLHSSCPTRFPEASHARDQGRENFMFSNPFLPNANDFKPLPLPPKKSSRAPKGMKKNKSRVHPSEGNSNRNFTPTTKAITALSREIKSSEEKKSKVQSSADSAPTTADGVGNKSSCTSDDQIVRFASSIEASQLSQQVRDGQCNVFGSVLGTALTYFQFRFSQFMIGTVKWGCDEPIRRQCERVCAVE